MLQEHQTRLQELHTELQRIQSAMCEAQREAALGPVDDHVLQGPNGAVRLSQLFGDKDDLVLVHNMGQRCSYCTMWGDGLSGLTRHIERRAAFVVVSPESPEAQQAFATSRGWPFTMVSSRGSTLERLLGFEDESGSRMPG